MKSCFAYIRVSTVRQGEQGVSLQEQRDAILAYAQKHNLKISHWFEEILTAAKRGRPEFATMLKRLHAKEVEGVVMHKIDRSARNLRDWADLADLIDAGIEFHFAADGLNLNTRSGRLSADIQAVVAADYIRNLSEEARKGFYGRLKQGLYPLKAPIGYLDHGGGKAKTPDPKRAPTIAKAFKLYATGEYSLRTLRDALPLTNSNGVPVSMTGWSNILNNPFYYGLIRIRRTDELFKGVHAPIISKAQFEHVQSVLLGKYAKRECKHDYLFKRLFQCAHCCRSMIGERQKGHVYYRCHTRDCPTKGINETHLSEELNSLLAQCQIHHQVAPRLLDLVRQTFTTQSIDLSSRIKGLQLTLDKLEARQSRLTIAYLDGLIGEDTFRTTKVNDALERERLVSEITHLKDRNGTFHHGIEKNLELAMSLISTYDQADKSRKRRLIKMATSNRVVDVKNIELEPSMPWATIQKVQAPLHCPQQRGVTRTEIDEMAEEILNCLVAHSGLDMSDLHNHPSSSDC